MANLTVRLYLLLMHSVFPQFQPQQAASNSDQFTLAQHQFREDLPGPVAFSHSGPLELREYMLLQNEKKH